MNYVFNPAGWCFDEGGGAWAALRTAFGSGAEERSVSCEKHYQWSVERYASNFQPKSQAVFKEMGMGLLQAVTPQQYVDTFNEIVEFIEEKADKRQFLHTFLKYWHPRRGHFSRAYKSENAPKMNMSETIHASYKNSGLIKLSLLKATFDDIAYAMTLERKILMLGEGVRCTGEGPSSSSKNSRKFYEDMRRSNHYADEILKGSNHEGESSVPKGPNDPNCRYIDQSVLPQKI